MDISNGSVLITGGAGGFGGATARRLAKLGAKVVLADVVDELVAPERVAGTDAAALATAGARGRCLCVR